MTSPPTGVLLINLGSPAAPTPEALRTYLAQFLGDPAVVDTPRLLWWPILHGIILRTRPKRSAAAYARVWTDEGSPLVVTTRAQGRLLGERLGEGWHVAVAMRYGVPTIADALDELQGAGCERFVVLPLFPQVHAATTGSVRAELVRCLAGRGLPYPDIVSGFHQDPGYVGAVAASIREARRDFDADHLLLSFHGLPERRGAIYREHCALTARAVADALGLRDDDWTLTFQSRFGPEPWLQPYTDVTAHELATRHPRLLVACPGFASDCLETIDEIGIELAHTFVEAGGRELRLVPGLDLRPDWIATLEGLVRATARRP